MIKKILIILIILGGCPMPMKQYYISKETETNLKEEITKAIVANAKGKIESALIKAIIKRESSNEVHAYRVDYSVLKRQSWYKNTLTEEQRKFKNCYASYGLMQILFGGARHYGFRGNPRELFDPSVNIKYGCEHLKYLMRRYSKIKDVIHAYNWGSNSWHDTDNDGVHDPDEKYKNQEYVDYIYTRYKRYGGKR